MIHRMIISKGAFYKLVDKLPFGPMDVTLLAEWIDNRFNEAGLKTEESGTIIVGMTGPRTRDIIQLARKGYDLSAAYGKVTPEAIRLAFDEIVSDEHDLLYTGWHSLTAHQQNVLRALAVNQKGLTTQETLTRFSLGQSGTVTNTVNTLIRQGHLVRLGAGSRNPARTGYAFDSPFFRAWVVRNALTDIGIYPHSTIADG
jgi:hypothetical protein